MHTILKSNIHSVYVDDILLSHPIYTLIPLRSSKISGILTLYNLLYRSLTYFYQCKKANV